MHALHTKYQFVEFCEKDIETYFKVFPCENFNSFEQWLDSLVVDQWASSVQISFHVYIGSSGASMTLTRRNLPCTNHIFNSFWRRWQFSEAALEKIAVLYLLIPSLLWKALPSPLVDCCGSQMWELSCWIQDHKMFTTINLINLFFFIPYWYPCVFLDWLSPRWSLPLLEPTWRWQT